VAQFFLTHSVDYVNIAGRSVRGRQTRVGWEQQAIFELIASIYLENGSRYVQNYY